MKLSRLALAIALVPTTHALAQTPDYDAALKLPETVVTASRTVQDRADTSAAVTVFTRTDIERLRPTTMAELLNRVPGVQLAQSGGRGSQTSLYIRGTGNAHSLILIDGQRVGSVSAGGASLQYLNPDMIERIEVLRGSRSAVYGADAMGGVIQIFTRRGQSEGIHPSLRIAAGSEGTWERTLGVSGGNGQTRYSLSASLEETNGIDRTHLSFGSDKDHDAFRNRGLNLNLSHSFNQDWQAGFSILDQRGKSEYDSPYGRYDSTTWMTYPSKPYSEFTLTSTSGYVDGRINDVWSTRVELGHSEDKMEDNDKLFAPSTSAFNSYRDSLAWINTLNLGHGHSLIVGADYLKDKLHSTTDYDEDSRWNHAGFIQHSFQGEHFSTELGLRHDKNQQYGSENTWNAALTVPLNENNELILSYAEGFRVPTFNDLYWPADPQWGSTANPNLDPERSKSYELQWRSQLTPSTRLEASIYRIDIRDMITYVYNPETWSGIYENVDKARINGFEANLEQELFGWQGRLSLSLIDPRDRKSGHTLNRRAKRTLSFDLDRQFGDFAVGASWYVSSKRYDDLDNTREISGYGVFDLRGSWQATPELALDVKLSNLFDKGYSQAMYQYANDYQYYNYREQPRAVLFGMTWTPKL